MPKYKCKLYWIALPTGVLVLRPPAQLPALTIKGKMLYSISYTNSAIAMLTTYLLATCHGVQVAETNTMNHTVKKNISTYVSYVIYSTTGCKEHCFLTNTMCT